MHFLVNILCKHFSMFGDTHFICCKILESLIFLSTLETIALATFAIIILFPPNSSTLPLLFLIFVAIVTLAFINVPLMSLLKQMEVFNGKWAGPMEIRPMDADSVCFYTIKWSAPSDISQSPPPLLLQAQLAQLWRHLSCSLLLSSSVCLHGSCIVYMVYFWKLTFLSLLQYSLKINDFFCRWLTLHYL